MGRIKAVLLDKDGTLVDFEATWLGIGQALAVAAADGDVGQADRLMALAGLDPVSGRVLPDSVFAAGTNADVVALWYPHLGPAERRERTEAFDAFTAREGATRAVPLPGMAEAVRALYAMGIRLGVATNDSTEGALRTLETLGLRPLFDAVYGYDAVANPKPAADPVLAFAAHLGISPAEVAVVGDNGHDQAMARAAGAGLAVGVLSGTGTRATLEPLADLILGSAAELPGFLGAMR